ncbi:MAG: DUF2505 domain-containing protein [Kofleriaceae bacterium]
MTSFQFEHLFRAPSVAAVFAVYTDRAHTADQDREVDIAEREFLEFVDEPTRFRRVSRVVPRRQLPAFVRPFLSGGLSFVETVDWDKAGDTISIEIRPSILGGRAQIHSTYRLVQDGPGAVRRIYAGSVEVDVRLVGGRIERAIVDDLGASMPVSAAVTQAWLDRASA